MTNPQVNLWDGIVMRTHGKRADSRRVVLLSSLDKPTIKVQIRRWQQAAAGSIEIDLIRREMSGKRPGFPRSDITRTWKLSRWAIIFTWWASLRAQKLEFGLKYYNFR
jgi:hypothetical protein